MVGAKQRCEGDGGGGSRSDNRMLLLLVSLVVDKLLTFSFKTLLFLTDIEHVFLEYQECRFLFLSALVGLIVGGLELHKLCPGK